MGIVDWLLGRPPDPTVDWPEFRRATPVLDLAKRSFNGLRFGETIDVARGLGRPDKFRWASRRHGELLYARGGFQVDFDPGLDYVALFIAADPFLPDAIGDVQFCEPVLRGERSDDFVATAATTIAEIEQHFGEPETRVADDEETVLTYDIHQCEVEFEFAPSSGLKRINVFPLPSD
jgi:hypothetical protein